MYMHVSLPLAFKSKTRIHKLIRIVEYSVLNFAVGLRELLRVLRGAQGAQVSCSGCSGSSGESTEPRVSRG